MLAFISAMSLQCLFCGLKISYYESLCGLGRTNKGTDELAIQLLCYLLDIEAPIRQEDPCVIDIVNPRGLDLDVVETGFGEFGDVFVIAQSTGHAAHPKLHVLLDFGRHIAPDNHIGAGKAAPRFEHPKIFFEPEVLCAATVYDA